MVAWGCIAVGVPLLVRAELGVAPFDVLNTGLSGTAGWSFGTAFVFSAAVLYALGVLLGARMGWASPAGTVVIGPMVNLVLSWIPHSERIAARLPLFVGGTLVIATGICLGIVADFGPGPTEVFMLGLVRRGMGIVTARWVSDGLPMVVGVALGGQLGVGTVLFLVGMGPLVKFGLRVLHFTPRQRLPAGSQLGRRFVEPGSGTPGGVPS